MAKATHTMTRNLAANLALALVLLGGMAILTGVGAAMVEPGPVAPMPNPHVPARWYGGGLFVLLAGTWLAGFAYPAAKKRSVIALLLAVLLPAIALWQAI